MVTLMILSHSPEIAKGTKALAGEMGKEATIVAVGGTADGAMGSDFEGTLQAMTEGVEKGEVVVLADLGSTRMTAEMAKEALDEAQQAKVFLNDAALVEGSVVAAVALAAGLDAPSVLQQLEEFQLNKD